MIHFKDTENKLHAIDSLEWVHLLPQGCVQITDEEAHAISNPPKTLDQARTEKKSQIRAAFEIDSNSPVNVGGLLFQGGFDSAIKLDAARRLAEAAGAIVVTFYDASNAGHVLSLSAAQNIILTVAGAYQSTFGRKQTAMVDVESSATLEQVNAISY